MTKKRIFIAKKADIHQNEILAVDVHGLAFVVVQICGRYYTFLDRCPHRDYPLSKGYFQEDTLICELHGRKYNLRTGECLRPPGAKSLDIYEVFEEGDDLSIDLESELLSTVDYDQCLTCITQTQYKGQTKDE
jgi:nitrite reductase/ring-hydroxylating ferredoxin subunit